MFAMTLSKADQEEDGILDILEEESDQQPEELAELPPGTEAYVFAF